MPIARDKRYRAKKAFIITAHHGHFISAIPVPESSTAEEAAIQMKTLAENHKPIVEESTILNRGRPVYRLWSLCGSTSRDDMESI